MDKILTYQHKNDIRIDKYLADSFSNVSRNQVQQSIQNGHVLVNGKTTKTNTKLKFGDVINYDFSFVIPSIENIKPEDIDLEIIFENDDLLVINKACGIITHPTTKIKSNTLINILLSKYPEIKNAIYDPKNPISTIRPGIVHRLDKDTSGTMIIAKNKATLTKLSALISKKLVKKTYLALVFGQPPLKSGQLINYLARDPIKRNTFSVSKNPIKSRQAILDYRLLSVFSIKNHKISLIEYDLITGRTHQIRVQSLHAGFPILGDKIYFNRDSFLFSKKYNINRQLLHSYQLKLTLPDKNIAKTFTANIPADFIFDSSININL